MKIGKDLKDHQVQPPTRHHMPAKPCPSGSQASNLQREEELQKGAETAGRLAARIREKHTRIAEMEERVRRMEEVRPPAPHVHLGACPGTASAGDEELIAFRVWGMLAVGIGTEKTAM